MFETKDFQRIFLTTLYGLLCLISVFFIFELVKKTLFGHIYYTELATNNKTKEQLLIAPRGVFFDREGVQLTINKKHSIYGYIRNYVNGAATAHVLGYLGLPGSVQLKDYSCGTPPITYQMVGVSGLERYFECRLRGRVGRALFETDAHGAQVSELARNSAQQGENIHLTLMASLAQAARAEFDNMKGAAIATIPRTGEVLLFYSSPSFDPHALLPESDGYADILQNSNQPFFNRLALGTYPPGSVVKPLFALAALEKNVITPTTTFEDTGVFKLAGVEFGNWYYLKYGKKEGSVDVVKALSRSNDIFFYQLGLRMGVKGLSRALYQFGLGAQDAFPYFVQQESVIPNSAWKKNTLGEQWYLGDSVNLSIGQGYLLVNPIQMHNAITALVQGRICALEFELRKQPRCRFVGVGQNSLQIVKKGMIEACKNGGTGWPFFDFKVQGKPMTVACKTGTAESQRKDLPAHAWFTVFAPADKPQIALTVLVENGGEGSYVAAPIAKKILEEYFKK